MVTPISELKVRAKILLKQSPALPELLKLAKGHQVQLKHCQHYVARNMGFSDWLHASQILACAGSLEGDYGSFWYQDRCATSLNHWCRHLPEAKQVMAQFGGVILPYKTQFFVATLAHFTNLGMYYDEALWQRVQGNWIDGDCGVRQALALQRINAQTTGVP